MITYENIALDWVIDSLLKIIKGEFSIKVYHDFSFKDRGNQWFNIIPVEDILPDTNSLTGGQGQNRQYSFQIRYYMDAVEGNTYDNHLKPLTAKAERLKRLLTNYRNYSPGGVYKYHDGRVEAIRYDIIELETSEEILQELTFFEMVFSCFANEVNLG